MGIVIRKNPGPSPVVVGGVTFFVHRMTFASREEIRAKCRKAGGGTVDPEAFARELHRTILAGWKGLKYEDTGEEIPFGPCPACTGSAASPATAGQPGTDLASGTPGQGLAGGVPGKAATCSGCGGSGDCRDWALSQFPADIWIALADEATRVLTREEEAAKN